VVLVWVLVSGLSLGGSRSSVGDISHESLTAVASRSQIDSFWEPLLDRGFAAAWLTFRIATPAFGSQPYWPCKHPVP
jgi:hypothetical protein